MISRTQLDYARRWGRNRQERGTRLLLDGKVFFVRQTRRRGYYEVESQTLSPGSEPFYNVILEGEEGVCECKDNQYRTQLCKHVRACRLWEMENQSEDA